MEKKINIFLSFMLTFAVFGTGTGCGVTPESPNTNADIVAPIISADDIPAKLGIGEQVVIVFTITDNLSDVSDISVEITVTDENNNDVTAIVYDAASRTFVSQSAGQFTVKVAARDEAGNSAEGYYNIAVSEIGDNNNNDDDNDDDDNDNNNDDDDGDGDGDGDFIEAPMFTLPSNPAFGNDVSVHDPSIFKDGNTYYTFGSHFAASSSTDLMHWTQYSSDNQWQKLYGSDWKTVLSDAYTYATAGSTKPGSTWAPDIIKLNGKYYKYYSMSTFGSSKSYIGRVQADSPTGAYSGSVEIIKSTGAGGTPNAIDAAVFFDNDGKLWLTYGSFFAGIYIIELYAAGDNIGLPKTQGIGKLLWQGSGSGPEGPYIFYNEITEYYYLMVSHGSLSTDYNMRVARSKLPDGPYLDVANRNVSVSSGGGNKLAGNYQFGGYAKGYAALGHNSVLKDNGKYFVVYHSRFKSGTGNVSGNHSQYVNQLFFNDDGWPVLAPNRYAGENAARVTLEAGGGEYDVLMHSSGNTAAFNTSTAYTLGGDGVILQGTASVGSWAISKNYYVTLTIGGTQYKGVIIPQWNNDRSKASLSITAVSDAGVSFWANAK
jgi:arabinan endo-1,5-alpha-L-arabinosidase